MTDAEIFVASLKTALEEALGIPVEAQSTPDNINIAFKYQVPLPFCLHIECEALQTHQEDIDGKPATVVDDFKIISAKLTQEQEDDPCQT